MLFSLLSDVIEPLSEFLQPLPAGWETLLPQAKPIVVAEPSTLKLALVGIATLAIYSLAGRVWRRNAAASVVHAEAPLAEAENSGANQETAPREAA